MTKLQAMALVFESKLNKYEKLFLLDFIYNEPEELVNIALQEFDIKRFLKKPKKEIQKTLGKLKKKAEKTYYSLGVKAAHHPVWSRVLQYPPAILDPTPGAAFKYPRVASDIRKGLSYLKKLQTKS